MYQDKFCRQLSCRKGAVSYNRESFALTGGVPKLLLRILDLHPTSQLETP